MELASKEKVKTRKASDTPKAPPSPLGSDSEDEYREALPDFLPSQWNIGKKTIKASVPRVNSLFWSLNDGFVSQIFHRILEIDEQTDDSVMEASQKKGQIRWTDFERLRLFHVSFLTSS